MMFRQCSRLLGAALAALLPGALPGYACAQDPRVLMSLNAGWRFKQSAEPAAVASPSFDDSSWEAVEIPHTWNRIGNEGTQRSPLSNSVQGTGWYRLKFAAPPTGARPRRYFLEFDAVGAIADVWLNGRHLGRHAGAFSRFRFDATAAVARSGENVLVVKADNSRAQPGSATADVIPLSGDFFVFGGIYRAVRLVATDPVHIDMLDYGGPGAYARALSIGPAAAVVQVSSRLVNDGPKPTRVRLETDVVDAEGKVVASASSQAVLPGSAGASSTALAHSRNSAAAASGVVNPAVISASVRVPQPRLWQGTRDPYLYRIVVTVRSPDGAILDRVTQPLGLRTLAFDPDKGFFLNGEHLLLRGAAMHQDRPVKGWAISPADQQQDFDFLTDMGGNAVRLAHYQHDARSYELADERGIVAWAEIPLVNQVSFDGTPASPALAANATRQLIELIRQNYNHPSIAVWSIANEVDLRATQASGASRPRALLESLNRLAKSEDPGRFTTLADCCEVGLPPHRGGDVAYSAPRDPIVGITDTVGYNRYFGWYTGTFADFGPMLDAAHARHAGLPLAVSEYGAGAALTQHSDDPAGGPINPHGRPHPEELQNAYHEASWNALRARPYLWGVFIWNLFDFSSDSRQEGDLTDVNEKGLVSYDRTVAKDAFYFYRANWSAQPTLHLVGRRYTDRPYAVLDVKAYSNATQAHLWLNGVEQGVTTCAGGICVWPGIHLASGANELRAEADVAGAQASDTLRWTFTGSPAIVRIKAGDISGYVAAKEQRYGSDAYFTGGEGRGVDPPDTPAGKATEVAGGDPRLYNSFREGDFSYRVPVPDGRYRITAGFVEPTAGKPGERVFDVKVNGRTVLQSFDPFTAAGGRLKGVERTFEASARDGNLLIEFRPSRGRALVCSLSITPASETDTR
jgi:beta-galactosidase